MPLNFRAFSNFGLSIVHCCFSFRWVTFDILDQISGHAWSILVIAWICVFPSGGFSLNCVNFVNPLHEPDKFGSTSIIPIIVYSAFLQHVQVSSPGHVNIFQWNWECFFCRHVELNSRFDKITINMIPWWLFTGSAKFQGKLCVFHWL